MSEALIVSVSGLRGVVGGSLTPDVAARYARCFAATLGPGPVVVGRDGRESGPLLLAAITDALTAAGRDVVDCGIAATPTVGIVVRSQRAAGGIQISASHNPAKYNGMKLFSPEGRVLTKEAGSRVLSRFEADGVPPPSAARGVVRKVDGTDEHVRLVAATVDVAAIRRHRPHVWLDSCRGAGSIVAKPLLEALGCRVTHVGAVPDGRFEHEPEPTASNLAALLPRIPESGADIGFFQDPDADRLAIATSDGRYIGEESTLALAVEHVLSRTPGPIVVNCSTSMMASIIAQSRGVRCHVSAVGEANVVERMLAEHAVIGGEGNGGVIDPRVGYVRDSFSAMALVLDRMSSGAELVSVDALARSMPALVMRKTKIDLAPGLGGPAMAAALDRIERSFPGARASRLDGLRLDWDGGWLLVRGSNTEPIVRVVAEARDEAAVDHAIGLAMAAVEGSGDG